MKYPKIQTLYKRSPETHKIIEWEHSRKEFANIKEWQCTEKIDGMNIRVYFKRDPDSLGSFHGVLFYGRTDSATIPPELTKYLSHMFAPEVFKAVFDDDVDEVWMFGEGYGPGIQNGGGYRKDQAFILFDVVVDGIWLERSSILDIADKFRIEAVPCITTKLPENLIEDEATMTIPEIIQFVQKDQWSNLKTMHNKRMEGLVCRPTPLMLFRDGTPILMKLKRKDYPLNMTADTEKALDYEEKCDSCGTIYLHNFVTTDNCPKLKCHGKLERTK